MVLRILLSACLFCLAATASAKEQYELKFATLMPTGTSWTNLLDDWVREVETRSNGRLVFKMYAGGVMGDEPDVLRKIRKGQLHGGMFTGYGIGRIYSPARVLEVPFLFKNTDESDYVREKMMPLFETGFRENGFELLGWPEVGFIHLFSTKPITSIEDLRDRNIWLWQGDPLGEAFFEAADIRPVPLSIIDVYTQLASRHGSIDTVYTSTFGAIALQWYTKLDYATEIPLTNAIGGLVVSNRFWNKLPPDLQALLKSSGAQMSDRIRRRARIENRNSIEILERNGIHFMFGWDDVDMDQVLDIRNRAATYLQKSDYIPDRIFQQARQLVTDYRQHRIAETGNAKPTMSDTE